MNPRLGQEGALKRLGAQSRRGEACLARGMIRLRAGLRVNPRGVGSTPGLTPGANQFHVHASTCAPGFTRAAQALQAVLQGALLLADPRVLAEYDEVTARPAFRFRDVERRALLEALEEIAEPVVAPPVPEPPRPR